MSTHSSSASSSPPEAYFDLGKYTRRITTQNEEAQLWFDRGLIWAYSFNHDEACECFRLALHHDPHCAMAYWGLAYAAGLNYNKTWIMFDSSDLRKSVQQCHNFVKKAKELASHEHVKPVERALIDAIQTRFPTDDLTTDSSGIDKAYAGAMQVVYEGFVNEDLDVTALYADALMQTAPRKLYHVRSGLRIEDSPVHKVRAVFDRAFQHPECEIHPGILHFWIHFMEMSCTPDVALSDADKLRHFVPDAGHIHHMPTHLDVLVGDYRRAVDSNTAATIADEKYLAKEGGQNFYSYYRLHNYHSLKYAAVLSGQLNVALKALDNMERSITDDLLRVESPPLADWMEFFKAVRVHVYIRFGKWEEIKRLPISEDQALYCVTTTMFHYGK